MPLTSDRLVAALAHVGSGPRRRLLAADSATLSSGTAEMLCLFSGLAALGLLLWMLSRRPAARTRRTGPIGSGKPTDPWAAIPTATMASDANAALVAADDALKTSEQELAFAGAKYGIDTTAEFTAALKASRADVMEAFRLKQLLDDDMPDDEPTRRDRFRQIIERCSAADLRLDAQVEAFDRLRDMESKLETLIDDLSARRAASVERQPIIEATCTRLVGSYAPAALLPISDSAAQHQERLTFAGRSLAQARASLASGQRPVAALGVRAAEEALGQVELLLNGVDDLASNLRTASESVRARLAEVESDVAAATAALAAAGGGSTGSPTVDLAAAVAGAEQVIAAVRSEMAEARPDPFAALRRLDTANHRLGAALASIRDAAGRAEHARALLETVLPSARAEVGSAATFIITRRGAVGSRARTRLAEAQRHLDQATTLTDTDPVAALSTAQQAESMAAQASWLANDDVSRWSQPEVVGGAMGGFGGAVLGGILLDSMIAGGRAGPRGPRAGFGTGFGWGGMVPGSFGGPGTRMRVRF